MTRPRDLRALALPLTLCALATPGPAASVPAPLPDGVTASGKTVQGVYLQGIATLGADVPGPSIPLVDPKQMLDIRSKQCMVAHQRPARIIQGKIEDLYQPGLARTYVSGPNMASFQETWMMLRNPDDSTGCDQRIFPAVTRTYTVFENGHTTMTKIEWNGTVHTQVIPGRTVPPSLQSLNREAIAHGAGPAATAGAMSSVAGIPCRQWRVTVQQMTQDLCVPDAESYPEPLSRMSLKSKISGPDGKVVAATDTNTILLATEIDQAVFAIPKSVERIR